MEEQPEYTLSVIALFDMNYPTDPLPPVSTFAYTLTTTGWFYALTGVGVSS